MATPVIDMRCALIRAIGAPLHLTSVLRALTSTTFAETQGHTLARSRNAFVMTDTDDKLIASAAIIGESSQPVIG